MDVRTQSKRVSWRTRDPGLRLLWTAARSWTLAAVVTLFPALFLVERWLGHLGSPVVPGLCLLIATFVVVPIGLFELWLPEQVSLAARQRAARAARLRRIGLHANVVAWAWFGLWLAWGL